MAPDAREPMEPWRDLARSTAERVADLLYGVWAGIDALVVFPRTGATQPGTYLGGGLAQRSGRSVVDPTPLFPFGHGQSYAPMAGH